MSVLVETSVGDIVIDLLVDYAPKACEKYVSVPATLRADYACMRFCGYDDTDVISD